MFERFLVVLQDPRKKKDLLETPFLVAKEEKRTDGNTQWCSRIVLVFKESCNNWHCHLPVCLGFFLEGGGGQWREAHRASINTVPCEPGQCGLLTWPLLHRPSLERGPA